MKTKLLLGILLINKIARCSEFDFEIQKENELSNYEQLLLNFKNIENILDEHKITKKDIDNIGNNFALNNNVMSFIKDDNLVIIIYDNLNESYYVDIKLLSSPIKRIR